LHDVATANCSDLYFLYKFKDSESRKLKRVRMGMK